MRTSRSSQNAFTMIEMIVVLVIVAMVSAVVFPSIASMLRSSTRSTSMSAAVGDVRVVTRLFQRDVRSARAPLRGTSDDTGLDATEDSVVQALDSNGDEQRDVVVAEPNRLMLWTEADGVAGDQELVTWQAFEGDARCVSRGASPTSWCVVRTVARRDRSVISEEVVVAGRGPFPRTDTCHTGAPTAARLFCYTVSGPRGSLLLTGAAARPFYAWQTWSPDCEQRDVAQVSPATIQVAHGPFAADANQSIDARDRITGIGMTAPSGGSYGFTTERTFQTTAATLRSRHDGGYQEAIMCGAR